MDEQSEDEIRTWAQRYVNDQMAIMGKYAPKLTAEQYGKLVGEVIKAAQAIRKPTTS